MLHLSPLYNGFGYVSATDDYKVVVALNFCVKVDVDIFSLRANVWKRVKAPDDQFQPMQSHHGTLLNEALHWLSEPQRDTEQAIFAFDLAKEEFRKVPLPVISEFDDMYFHHVGLLEGCVCVSRCKSDVCESIDFWVMTEYDEPESWTNLFRLKIFDQPKPISNWTFKPIFVTENGTVVASKCSSTDMELIRIGKKKEKLDDKNDKVVVWDGRYIQ